MRVQDILRMFGDYLRLGLVLLALVLIILLVGYFIIYKKIGRGKRNLDLKKMFWWMTFIFYLFVVLSITLIRRSGFWNGQIISFFYSYKEAWISASETSWRNIILNILMFVPLGFWLPVGKKGFRTFWKPCLLGLGLTVVIECLQLFLSLGLFEVADLFNNTLGTMIGYGFYKLVEYVVQLFKKEKPKVLRMIAYQIPLILTVCMFTIIFLAYQMQELGNLPIECISSYSKDAFQIVSNGKYNKDTKTVMIYQSNILSVNETEAFARNFFENLGTSLDESRSDIYEDTAVYWAEDSYSMWINYNGGTYDMTDFDVSFPEEGEPQRLQVTDEAEEEIRKALLEYGIEVPEAASFSHSEETGYTFIVDRVEVNGIIYDGQLTCDYYGNNKFSSIRNDIRQLETYKEFEICSEYEAYEKILNGEFICSANAGEKIEVGQVSLDYMMDTKGFYQPIYTFEVVVNGELQFVQIPAINS